MAFPQAFIDELVKRIDENAMINKRSSTPNRPPAAGFFFFSAFVYCTAPAPFAANCRCFLSQLFCERIQLGHNLSYKLL